MNAKASDTVCCSLPNQAMEMLVMRVDVAIGEEAARVDELLEKVADRMQEEIQSLVEALTALLQPALILLMGGIVGFIALAVLLPMLSMNQLLQ